MPREKRGAFRYWRDPVFLAGLLLYAVNRLLIRPYFVHRHQYSSFFQGHLDDALTAPVALPIFLGAYRLIGFRPDDEMPRWWEILLHVAVWIAFFKWYGPFALHQGVADPIDIVSMLIGGVIAWLLWHRQTLRRSDVAAR
jgi:hypothetical protein